MPQLSPPETPTSSPDSGALADSNQILFGPFQPQVHIVEGPQTLATVEQNAIAPVLTTANLTVAYYIS